MPFPEWLIGLDLGQASDYTALAIVERVIAANNPDAKREGVYHLRHAERLPLGTSYPAIVRHVGDLLGRSELTGLRTLLVDATGVGRPVVDLLRQARLEPVPVVVHGGNETTTDANGFRRVPKRELVSTAQVCLQGGRLKFAAALPVVQTLIDELLKFEVKITATGHDTYGAWREGSHDDLVFALALATWYGERVAAGRALQAANANGQPYQVAMREVPRPSKGNLLRDEWRKGVDPFTRKVTPGRA